MIIESGKYKGKKLVDCPVEYLEWASKHEKNFAKRNQWISRDAKILLDKLAKQAEAAQAKRYSAPLQVKKAVKVKVVQQFNDGMYFVDEDNNPLCCNCVEEESYDYDERCNRTGKSIQCDGCGEDILPVNKMSRAMSAR